MGLRALNQCARGLPVLCTESLLLVRVHNAAPFEGPYWHCGGFNGAGEG